MTDSLQKPVRVVSAARRRFVRGKRCIVPMCGEPGECAHVKVRRMGGDVANVVPMCHWHHIGCLHQMGIATFQSRFRVNLQKLAKLWEKRFQLSNPEDLAF